MAAPESESCFTTTRLRCVCMFSACVERISFNHLVEYVIIAACRRNCVLRGEGE